MFAKNNKNLKRKFTLGSQSKIVKFLFIFLQNQSIQKLIKLRILNFATFKIHFTNLCLTVIKKLN